MYRRLHHIPLVLLLIVFTSCGLKVTGVPENLQALSQTGHNQTVWIIQPSYEHDALAFLNLLSGDHYFNSFYADSPADTWRAKLDQHERKAVASLKFWIRDRFGGSLSSLLTYLYELCGVNTLDEFSVLLADPSRLRQRFDNELDTMSLAMLGGWRIPAPLFALLCRNLVVYLNYLERVEFRQAWEQNQKPYLEQLAASLHKELVMVNLLPAVESALGGGLPNKTVTILLGYWLRPNGISLGANRLLMEDRTDAKNMIAVAAHELIHGYANWSQPPLDQIPRLLAADPLTVRRFKERDTGYNYNNWIAITEEAWTKALDQLVQYTLFGSDAPDPKERWWFQDNGLHPGALAFYTLLQKRSPDFEGTAAEWLAQELLEGRIAENFASACWEEQFGLDRPGELPHQPAIRNIYPAGSSRLDQLNPVYNTILKPGQFIVFLDDWFSYDGTARESLHILNRLGQALTGQELLDPASGKTYRGKFLFAGNVSTERDGQNWYYRNTLYFEAVSDGVDP